MEMENERYFDVFKALDPAIHNIPGLLRLKPSSFGKGWIEIHSIVALEQHGGRTLIAIIPSEFRNYAEFFIAASKHVPEMLRLYQMKEG